MSEKSARPRQNYGWDLKGGWELLREEEQQKVQEEVPARAKAGGSARAAQALDKIYFWSPFYSFQQMDATGSQPLGSNIHVRNKHINPIKGGTWRLRAQ